MQSLYAIQVVRLALAAIVLEVQAAGRGLASAGVDKLDPNLDSYPIKFPPMGFSECPCVSNTSDLGKGIIEVTKKLGLPAGYGTNGCAEYDEFLDYPRGCQQAAAVQCVVGCNSKQKPQYCNLRWCFVDESKCRINKEECERYGGQLGSSQPGCRDRDHVESQYFHHPVDPSKQKKDLEPWETRTQEGYYWSYNTCANPNTFSTDDDKTDFSRVLRVSTFKRAPWPMAHDVSPTIDVLRPELQIETTGEAINGALIEAFHDMIKQYFNSGAFTGAGGSAQEKSVGAPQSQVQIVIQNEGMMASKDALSLVQSNMIKENKSMETGADAFTACAIDVALGNTDVCVGYIWHTQERERFVSFLPPITIDEMILIHYHKSSKYAGFFGELGGYLEVPFEPFHAESWAYIFGFLAIAGLAIFLSELKEHSADFPFPKKNYVFLRFGRSLYLSLQGFFQGRIQLDSPTIPSKFVNLGFTVFVFVVLSSYIANLTAMLINKDLVQEINGIQDVLYYRIRTCVLEFDILGKQLSAKYPGLLDLLVNSNEQNIWTHLHRGTCETAIIPQSTWTRALSGEFAKDDCNRGGDFWCEQNDDDGLPDLQRDCRSFSKIGDGLLALPIAWPVASNIIGSLRKAWMDYKDSGRWEKKDAEYSKRKPPSVCDVQKVDNHPGYRAHRVYGAVIIGCLILIIALAFWLVEYHFDRHISALLGYPDPWLEEKQREFKKLIKKLHGLEDMEENEGMYSHAPAHDPMASGEDEEANEIDVADDDDWGGAQSYAGSMDALGNKIWQSEFSQASGRLPGAQGSMYSTQGVMIGSQSGTDHATSYGAATESRLDGSQDASIENVTRTIDQIDATKNNYGTT